jgi:glycosyltransferase involved in cell wall biosynthesis
MLSILIPTYNYDVSKLVVELQKQATKAELIFEIIVVDDASVQAKLIANNEQINSIKNCKYILQSENRGRTRTRQHLATLSKFDNLLFLDADVLPKQHNFIQNFEVGNPGWELKFGGIAYKMETPKKEEILRWKYGKSRESLSLIQRQKNPYLSINSGAFLIKKNIFLDINSELDFKVYGLDNLFKQLLQKDNVKVVHIDNPVYHLGLENATHFIEKSKEAVKTTVDLEEKGLIDSNLRPIQKAYIKFKKYGLIRTFKFLMKVFNDSIQQNLKSKSPSLILFDLYRLSYYIDLKSQNDA